MEETGLKVEIIGQKDNSLADEKADVTVLYNPYVVLCELINGKPQSDTKPESSNQPSAHQNNI